MSNQVELIQHQDAYSFNQRVRDFLLRKAALTQRLLDDGQRYCFLYADKKNAFSNRMYEAIGYQLMGETQNYRFATADA